MGNLSNPTQLLGTIYALSLAGTVRYVGQTIKTAEVRLQGHVTSAHSGDTAPVHRWIRKNGKPDLIILEYVDYSALDEAEQKWIAYFHRLTMNLLNCTIGGQFETVHLEGYRLRVSEAVTQVWENRSTEERAAVAHKGWETRRANGWETTDAARTAMSTGQSGRKHPPEVKEKIGNSNRGKTRKMPKCKSDCLCKRHTARVIALRDTNV